MWAVMHMLDTPWWMWKTGAGGWEGDFTGETRVSSGAAGGASRRIWVIFVIIYCQVPTDSRLILMKLTDTFVTRWESKLDNTFFPLRILCFLGMLPLWAPGSSLLGRGQMKNRALFPLSLLPKDNPTTVDSSSPSLVFWSVGQARRNNLGSLKQRETPKVYSTCVLRAVYLEIVSRPYIILICLETSIVRQT